jgi:hypothetical protein
VAAPASAPLPSYRLAAETAARRQRRAASIRKHAWIGLLKCHATATCVRGRGHCERLVDRHGSSSGPGYESTRPVAHSTPAGRTKNLKKNFCCVTTRRRNLWTIRRLRCGLGPLTAHALSLGVLRFDRFGLATPGLPPCRLPSADFPQAFRGLAVALVPPPWAVSPPTTFAQADPQARSSLSGTTAGLWLIVGGAHGSCVSQGSARRERVNVLFGRFSKREQREPDCSHPA